MHIALFVHLFLLKEFIQSHHRVVFVLLVNLDSLEIFPLIGQALDGVGIVTRPSAKKIAQMIVLCIVLWHRKTVVAAQTAKNLVLLLHQDYVNPMQIMYQVQLYIMHAKMEIRGTGLVHMVDQ